MKNIIVFSRTALFFVKFAFLISCTDTVDITVPDAGARLVVEASINWEKGTSGQRQTITLRESTPYFDSNRDVPVTGAIVTITKDDDGQRFEFVDQDNGDYVVTDFAPQLNQSYTLEILYNEQMYRASETLLPVSTINAVVQGLEGTGEDAEVQLQIFFDDPAGIDNYYLGEFIPSNLPIPSLAVIRDEFTDGNENFIDNDNENYIAGVNVGINLYGISQRYYDYLNILIEQSGNGGGGGPFTTTPVQIHGNCINVDNPSEEVLGYFRLSEVARTVYTIN